MYFASRLQAGRMLAAQLTKKYRYENCAIVAVNDGGVMVGAQIAAELHCVLTLLVSSEITLPREPEAVAGITSGGTVSYNKEYSEGELDEILGEYYNVVEQEKLVKMHDMNHLLGGEGTIDKRLLRGRNVIIVTDGLKSGFQVDLAAEFLKPIQIEKLIVATPLASVQAVDRMHVLADDLYCLNVVENYMETEHYYDKQDVPEHEAAVKIISEIILNWK
ncbi:MAG TPA: phosphoribosyltransferase family protein [Candidatus Saccharimonadales bacterium]|nr:phosphoribosyltransferase family protein [Candidatus Saccharimonadales bacterium]